MRVALFSAKKYERKLLDELNADHRHELVYFDALLEPETVSLAAGFPAVSVFTNDTVDGDARKRLAAGGRKPCAPATTRLKPIELAAPPDPWRKGSPGTAPLTKPPPPSR